MFDSIKRAISQDTLVVCSDFNTRFDIHTDAIDFQLVSMISQNRKPIAFYSRNLTGLQTWYTVTKKELMSIVEALK